MSLIPMKDVAKEAILNCAKAMCLAAQTAPKACGKDSIVTAVLTGVEIERLCAEMERIQDTTPNVRPIYKRDAALVRNCQAVVLIGNVRYRRALVPCGYCGFESCANSAQNGAHCAFDDMDLGIALGSAASVAMDYRVDNRILYTVGVAAMNLSFLHRPVQSVIGIPLTYGERNPFFFEDNRVRIV